MSILADQVVLITGGGSGIGLAAAKLFLEQAPSKAMTPIDVNAGLTLGMGLNTG